MFFSIRKRRNPLTNIDLCLVEKYGRFHVCLLTRIWKKYWFHPKLWVIRSFLQLWGILCSSTLIQQPRCGFASQFHWHQIVSQQVQRYHHGKSLIKQRPVQSNMETTNRHPELLAMYVQRCKLQPFILSLKDALHSSAMHVMSMCPCVAFADQLCTGSVSDLCEVSGAEGRSNQVYSVWDSKSIRLWCGGPIMSCLFLCLCGPDFTTSMSRPGLQMAISAPPCCVCAMILHKSWCNIKHCCIVNVTDGTGFQGC